MTDRATGPETRASHFGLGTRRMPTKRPTNKIASTREVLVALCLYTKVNTGEPYLFCIFKFSFLTRSHFICSIISVATYHTEAYYCSAGGRQRLGWYGIPEEHATTATTFLRLESGSISESHEKVSTKTEHACGIKTRESFYWRVESSSTNEREECM